jgi:hypothetical protein
VLFVFFPAAQGLHGIPTALHRAGRLHQQDTMLHSGASSSDAGYDFDIVFNHPLKSLIRTLLVSMIYMMFMFNWNNHYISVIYIMIMMFLSILNKRLIDVTTVMIISFYWIKLNLKLPIILTDDTWVTLNRCLIEHLR